MLEVTGIYKTPGRSESYLISWGRILLINVFHNVHEVVYGCKNERRIVVANGQDPIQFFAILKNMENVLDILTTL